MRRPDDGAFLVGAAVSLVAVVLAAFVRNSPAPAKDDDADDVQVQPIH